MGFRFHPHSAHQSAWLSSRRREVSLDSWTLHDEKSDSDRSRWGIPTGWWGLPKPLWKMMENSSVGMIIPFPTEWKVIIHSCSSHHQPAIIFPRPWSSRRRNFNLPMVLVQKDPLKWRMDLSKKCSISVQTAIPILTQKKNLENGGGGTLSIEKDQHPAF